MNQLKKALKDLVVFTDHHRGRTWHRPQHRTFTLPSLLKMGTLSCK